MIHKIITPDLQANSYQFDSKDVFYSIDENYLGIVTPGRKILINYNDKPKFVPGGKDYDDMQIINSNQNLNEKELSALEQFKVLI